MSGRRREIPLHDVVNRTRWVLKVDLTTHTRRPSTAEVSLGDGPGPERTFTFSCEMQQIQATEVLRGGEGAPGLDEPVCFVSEAVQRAKHYQVRLHADGVRKIMYYDECAAFERPLKGPEALLLLAGYDVDLGAHRASMGDGLLPLDLMEEVLDAGRDDRPSPP